MAGDKDPYRLGVANGLRMARATLQGVPYIPIDPLPTVTLADPVKEPVKDAAAPTKASAPVAASKAKDSKAKR
jgi:hypothetical protein